jgi:hypothetical protein
MFFFEGGEAGDFSGASAFDFDGVEARAFGEESAVFARRELFLANWELIPNL